MKILLSIFFFLSLVGTVSDISKLREVYPDLVGDKEAIVKVNEDLSGVTKKDDAVLVAYKGAVQTLMSKYTKGKENKKKYFKDGVEHLEHAITTKPNNIEIRVLRLSVQENSPKFLKYHLNIATDKEFILDNYQQTTSKSVKAFVRSYVLQSKGFSDIEKEQF